MSYEDRIDAALAAIKQHNETVGGEEKPGYVNPDAFIACVKASGGSNEERLAALSHEDLLACMPSYHMNGIEVKPRVLAKNIAQIFRSNQPQGSEEKRPVSGKKADKMTPKELVEAFDPEDYSNPVGQRLATMSKGEKFIVYTDGRVVDVETTFRLLSEIRGGYPGRDDVNVGSQVKRVYKVGELPEAYADENPLYRGRPLRPDGTCDQTGRSWEGVSQEIRQLVRVTMDVGELNVNLETAHAALDMAVTDNARTKLRDRYRKAAIKYDELAKTGRLPQLKIALGSPIEGGSESKSPFSQGKKVQWAGATVNINPAILIQKGGQWRYWRAR